MSARVRVTREHQSNSMKQKLLPLILLSVLWAAIGTGCNTANGLGKDVEKAGNKIQDAAK
jgi:predicted small secreted protein